jgi:release factor glutamine methyltransferase
MSAVAEAATLGAALRAAAERLAEAGIAESRREARLLVALALGIAPAEASIDPERVLDRAAAARLAALLARRAAREPFSRLAGKREFWSLDFALSPATLDPRPDSETVIETALALLPDRNAPRRILDLGTGTGCLLLALLSELPRAVGVGVDLHPGAATTARRNAAALGLAERAVFAVGWWGSALSGEADVILANPPYIPSQAIDGLAPEVARWDPRIALDGGTDGLQAYRELAAETRRLLAPGGIACFEVGEGQTPRVAGLMVEAGLSVEEIRRDLAGIERCVAVSPNKVREIEGRQPSN